MKLTTDYKAHDNIYQKLKTTGALGWGGDRYESRMAAWHQSIQDLRLISNFPKPPATLLEIGSGAGDVTLKFSEIGYQTFGIEISMTAVKWAQEKSEALGLNAKFCQGSACDLSYYEDNFFKVVIDGNCLHCIIGDDRKRLLKEVYRVLSPGGLFFISTMVGDPKTTNPQLQFDPVTRCQLDNGVAVRYMGFKDHVLDEISSSGFEILETRVNDNPWWQHLHCLVRKFNRL